jgi:hypothetical protein
VTRTIVQVLAYQYAHLREVVRSRRPAGGEAGDGGDRGMTTLEVLIIAGALIALGVGAVALITTTAAGKVGGGAQSPTSFLSN